MDSGAPDLSVDDFMQLLRMATLDDVYILDGKVRKQVTGLAMGNNAAPILSSLFMYFVEERILQSCDIPFWVRYADDIFLIYKQCDDILENANKIHGHIKFTLEDSVDNSLPFLDTLVSLDAATNLFNFSLFVKPCHSGACLPFSAHVPAQRKRALLIGEKYRLLRNSSKDNTFPSATILRQRFANNGYPTKWLNKYFDSDPRERAKLDRPTPRTFVRLPFTGERTRRRIFDLANRTGLADHVRILFTTERPLGQRWRLQKERPRCDAQCWTCETAEVRRRCYTKYAVYELTCRQCQAKYVGQTARTVRSRIREHVTSASSAFFRHVMECHQSIPQECLRWRILRIERDGVARLALESLEIGKRDHLVNDCSGEQLLPFLAVA